MGTEHERECEGFSKVNSVSHIDVSTLYNWPSSSQREHVLMTQNFLSKFLHFLLSLSTMGESPNRKLRGLAPQANPGTMFSKCKNFAKSLITSLGLVYKKRDNCYSSFFFFLVQKKKDEKHLLWIWVQSSTRKISAMTNTIFIINGDQRMALPTMINQGRTEFCWN